MTISSPRMIIAAGTAYVTGWIAGLLVAPTGPAATVAPAVVQAYYAANGPAIRLQSLLVHGIPGIALAVLGISVAGNLRAGGHARSTITASAVTAAVLSLGQVGVAVVSVTTADTAAATTTAALFRALNLADTAKLVALAAFAAGESLGRPPPWRRTRLVRRAHRRARPVAPGRRRRLPPRPAGAVGAVDRVAAAAARLGRRPDRRRCARDPDGPARHGCLRPPEQVALKCLYLVARQWTGWVCPGTMGGEEAANCWRPLSPASCDRVRRGDVRHP
jgi:hypothetical protein